MDFFNCRCCGDCCSGEMIINLNIYDLFKMARHLSLKNTKELFDKGFVKLSIGQNGVYIPQIKFKTVPYKFCPFLINDLNEEMVLKGYCSLHPYKKPLVCILAPYSKEFDTKTKDVNYFYTKPTENCPGELLEGKTSNILPDSLHLEIEYEGDFFNLLQLIRDKNLIDYCNKLYYFPTSDNFPELFDKIKSNFIENI